MISNRFVDDDRPSIILNSIQCNALYHFKRDIEQGGYEYEEYPCECGCKPNELITIAEKDRYGICVSTKICPKCGIVMTNPRMNQRSYNKFYSKYYRRLYVGQLEPSDLYFQEQIIRGRAIYSYIRDNIGFDEIQNVLEIGCSSGGIIFVFKEHGFNVKGIDLENEYIQFGKKRNLDLQCQNSQEFASKNPSLKFDLIILSHVFEHFLDIEKELKEIRNLLSENGYVFIAVPGIKYIRETYQGDLLKYLQNAHVRHYCKDSLEYVMRKYGFRMICGDEKVNAVFSRLRSEEIIPENKDSANEILKYLFLLENNIFDSPSDKNNNLTIIMEQWIRYLYTKKIELSRIIKAYGYNKIAIYGAGVIGRLVFESLKDSEIEVLFFIDRSAEGDIFGKKIYKPEEKKPQADVIMIATGYDYWDIYKSIFGEYSFLTLQDIFDECSLMEGI